MAKLKNVYKCIPHYDPDSDNEILFAWAEDIYAQGDLNVFDICEWTGAPLDIIQRAAREGGWNKKRKRRLRTTLKKIIGGKQLYLDQLIGKLMLACNMTIDKLMGENVDFSLEDVTQMVNLLKELQDIANLGANKIAPNFSLFAAGNLNISWESVAERLKASDVIDYDGGAKAIAYGEREGTDSARAVSSGEAIPASRGVETPRQAKSDCQRDIQRRLQEGSNRQGTEGGGDGAGGVSADADNRPRTLASYLLNRPYAESRSRDSVAQPEDTPSGS